MSLDLADPDLAALHARLAPYAAYLLHRAGAYAAAQHADEVGPEHLLSTLMGDEECAAHRTVLFAFADPETIAEEARALSAGILVSGSRVTLPFSTHGVLALRDARERAVRDRGPVIRVAHLLAAAIAALPEELASALVDAGYEAAQLEAAARPDAAATPPPLDGPLFRYFDTEAKQVLLQAARQAQTEKLPSIGPVPLALAALRAEPELEAAAGLSAARLRVILHGHGADDAPPPAARLAADDSLVQFLRGLRPGATSLDRLGQYHAGSTAELSDLLARHKVTLALLGRTEKAYADPDRAP